MKKFIISGLLAVVFLLSGVTALAQTQGSLAVKDANSTGQSLCNVSSATGSVLVQCADLYVQGTQVSSGNPVPTSVASLPLPSGAATAANQVTANTSLAAIATNTTNPVLGAGSNAIGSITNTGFAATQSGTWNMGGLTGVAQSASVTRPANTTAYAAGQAICASTSANCTPMQITVAGANGATGTFGRVWLLKSGSSTANATFALYLYSTSPTVASVHDASSYVGPFAADLPGYLGSWNCITANLTSDATAQVYYECVPTAAQGWNQYQAATGVKYVYGMLAATAAYTPASGEAFTAYVNSLQDK